MNVLYLHVLTSSLFSSRCGRVTFPLFPHHAKFPAQDAGATLHPETCRENPVTWGPARHDAHPCCWGCKVCHHLPRILTGWDRRQCWPTGKRGFWRLSFSHCVCLISHSGDVNQPDVCWMSSYHFRGCTFFCKWFLGRGCLKKFM